MPARNLDTGDVLLIVGVGIQALMTCTTTELAYFDLIILGSYSKMGELNLTSFANT
jgi:hypothetical protein